MCRVKTSNIKRNLKRKSGEQRRNVWTFPYQQLPNIIFFVRSIINNKIIIENLLRNIEYLRVKCLNNTNNLLNPELCCGFN